MIKAKNPILLNVSYIKPTKANNNKECFEIIFKNDINETQRAEEPAESLIYFVKPEFRNYDYNKPEERISSMYTVKSPISKIRYKIAEEMGDEGKQIIKQAYEQRDFRRLNQLYKWRYSYGADFQPEFYFMRDWYGKHTMTMPKLSIAYLDIECDMIDTRINMDKISDTAYAPVNAVTVILDESKEAWTFLLKPYEPSKLGRTEEEYKERYKLYESQKRQHEFLMNNKDEFIRDLNNSFDPTYGHLSYHIRDYDKEINLIADIFGLINKRKPDFCLAWNMRFDVQYLYYRIIALGYDPSTIMCSKDFDDRRCYFKVDRSTFELAKQYDFFYCSSYTQYICQMRLYASIRKSQHALKSVKLNAIADKELKDKKVEYEDEGNIIMFAYLNWLKFVKYNIKDVLLQLGIERKCHDVMSYYNKSHSNWTPYAKIFKETHLLRNVREQYFEQEGWVQGNNLNIIDDIYDDSRSFYGKSVDEEEDEEASFKGAINADPIWNDKCGIRILGMKSNNMHSNAMDYDMGAFYPSIKIASNMDPITLMYKASFYNDEFLSGEYYNRSLNNKYIEKDKNGNIRKLDFTGEAVNTYVSNNPQTFMYNYEGVPTTTMFIRFVLTELS